MKYLPLHTNAKLIKSTKKKMSTVSLIFKVKFTRNFFFSSKRQFREVVKKCELPMGNENKMGTSVESQTNAYETVHNTLK